MKIAWYGFLGLFGVVGASLALLNGAGVLFGSILVGFAVLLHLAWLGVGELRRSREAQERALETQARCLNATEKMATNLEWALFAPEPEAPTALRQEAKT